MVLRTVYLPPDVDAALRQRAFDLQCSKADLIREYVQTGLKSGLAPDLSVSRGDAMRLLFTGLEQRLPALKGKRLREVAEVCVQLIERHLGRRFLRAAVAATAPDAAINSIKTTVRATKIEQTSARTASSQRIQIASSKMSDSARMS